MTTESSIAIKEQTKSKTDRDADARPGTPAKFRLSRDPRGRLVLHLAERSKPFENVRLTRCFPWSRHDQYVSVRDADGKEQVLLETLDGVDDASRQLIEQELALQEFVPHITAVVSVDDSYEVMIWKVQTDRGDVELQIKSHDDIRQVDDDRVLVRDHAGGLFEITSLCALDAASQRLVEDHMS